MRRRKKKINNYIYVLISIITMLFGYFYYSYGYQNHELSEVFDYTDKEYIYINNNKSTFDDSLKIVDSYQKFSELDYLGRCGKAIANISKKMMPTKARESIGMVKPSGWHTVKYDIIKDKYLYNRCHLIGYQLTGENANPKNLITCTRQMNTGVMLKYENMVANYLKNTNNHVLYLVEPIYNGADLVAYGAHMMAYSIEDDGKGIDFNIFVYNIQDGIEINYSDGTSKLKK